MNLTYAPILMFFFADSIRKRKNASSGLPVPQANNVFFLLSIGLLSKMYADSIQYQSLLLSYDSIVKLLCKDISPALNLQPENQRNIGSMSSHSHPVNTVKGNHTQVKIGALVTSVWTSSRRRYKRESRCYYVSVAARGHVFSLLDCRQFSVVKFPFFFNLLLSPHWQ